MRGLVPGLESPYPLLLSLPGLYQEDSFTQRFTAAFDEMLAPVISTLDNLSAYVDPSLTPTDFVEWLAQWVGFPIGESWPEERARELLAAAVELYRWQGTTRGLAGLLSLYAGVTLEVEDTGGVSWSASPGSSLEGKVEPRVTIRVRQSASDPVDLRQLESLVAAAKPAHVDHVIEVVDQ